MKKQIIAITAVLLCSIAAMGQSKNEFSIYGAGGLSTLNYKLSHGDLKLGFGGSAGLGYTFFFNRHWGLGTGAELSFYNSKAKMNDYFSSHMATDIDGQSFEARYRLNNFEEKQNAMFVNIPLMLQFQTGENHQFYAAAGAKLGIPVKVKYSTTDDSNILSSGYYAGENVEYTSQEFLGFGTLNGKKAEDDIKLKLACLISIEAGVKWKLNENLYLYTGAYFDYGVNNINKDQNDNFLVRGNLSRDFTTNSVLTSSTDGTLLADKVRPMAAGLKVRLAFGTGSSERERIVERTRVKTDGTPRTARREPAKTQPKVDNSSQRVAAEAERRAEAERLERERAAAAAYQTALAEMAQPINNYELGAEDLDATRRSVIDKKIAIMKQYPNMKVTLEGHTCDIDTDRVNLREGMLRSEAVKKYMVDRGISADRLTTTSKGLEDPVVPNTNETNRKKNRRVEFIVNNK